MRESWIWPEVWTQWPASFKLQKDKVIAIYAERPPREWRKPEYIAYTLELAGNYRLDDFIDIDGSQKLIEYLTINGFPHFQATFQQMKSFPIKELLEAASYLRWIVELLRAYKEQSLESLKSFCEIKKGEKSNGEKGWYLSPERAGFYVHWNGFKKLNDSNQSKAKPILWIVTTEKEIRASSWRVPTKEVNEYLIEAINLLVEGISPRIGKRFSPVFSPRTPYEAMCLALYMRATGSIMERKCKRKLCGEYVWISKETNGRKKRSDTAYCSQKCRQRVYDSNKRIKKQEQQEKLEARLYARKKRNQEKQQRKKRTL